MENKEDINKEVNKIIEDADPKEEGEIIIEEPKPEEEKKEIEEPKPREDIEPPKNIKSKPKTIPQQLAEMIESLKVFKDLEATKVKKKAFKMPAGIKRKTKNLKKLMNKNRVQVMILKRSRQIETTIGEINTGQLKVGELIYNAADDIIWMWQGKTPTAVVCDWDMQPLTVTRLMADTNILKTWLHPQTLILRSIVAKTAADSAITKKMSIGAFIIIGVVILVAYYVLRGGT